MHPEAEALLAWYDLNRRDLPWRGCGDPYAVWVSEIMLQQTRVETVLRYFSAFMEAFPTVGALASAEEEAVLKRWEGLGYYSRARSLHAGAKQVAAAGGRLPRTAAELRRIRGIGPYTAGAIASIAFGERVSAVDGNVIRVMSRLRGIRASMEAAASRRAVQDAADALVPAERPGDFNQALMDLGSAVCVSGTPECGRCPLRPFCDAARAGDAARLPVLPSQRPRRELRWEVLLPLLPDGVPVRRRTERLLQGLWVFPMAPACASEEELLHALRCLTGLTAERAVPLGDCAHIFTHQAWKMRVWLIPAPAGELRPEWRLASAEDLRALPLPSAMRVPAGHALALLDADRAAEYDAGGKLGQG